MSDLQNLTFGFSWVPPDLSYLHYKNCTAASVWAESVLRSSTHDIPYRSTTETLADALSDYLAENQLADPLPGELMIWFTYNMENQNATLGISMLEFAIGTCLEQLCPILGWQGNSDVAGRGVRVQSHYVSFRIVCRSYFLQRLRLVTTDACQFHNPGQPCDFILHHPCARQERVDINKPRKALHHWENYCSRAALDTRIC
jgi:hypothetical protein